jgi:hypothetical protein
MSRTVQHPPELQVIKAASKALVRAFGGTDAAAVHVGVRQQRMSDIGLPNTPDFLRIDEVLALESCTVGTVGHPHVTRALAAATGHIVASLPTGAACASDWLGGMGPLAKEAGDVTARIAAALSDDGEVDAAEADNIIREIDEAFTVLAALRVLAERRAMERPG